MPFAHAHEMKNGYCSLMTQTATSHCTPRLFFSTPKRTYDNEQMGIPYSDNSAWITHNRFVAENIGDESTECLSKYFFNSDLIQCLAAWTHSLFPVKSCDEIVINEPKWG